MKKWTPLLGLCVGALGMVLGSCTNGGVEPNSPVTTTIVATTPPASVVVSESPDNSNCIGCHTDQEALFVLAEEPEENTLNEGEG